MTNKLSPSEFEGLWKSQPPEPRKIDPEDIRRGMRRFERRITRRNLREYLAGVLVVCIFAYYTYLFPVPLARIGCALMIAGTLYVLFELHRRASAELVPAGLAQNSLVEFQKRQLERQRDALRSVWIWYLLPFVPGMCVFLIGLFDFALRTASEAGRPVEAGRLALSFGLVVAVVAAVFFAVWKLNQHATRKLESEIEELDALMREPD